MTCSPISSSSTPTARRSRASVLLRWPFPANDGSHHDDNDARAAATRLRRGSLLSYGLPTHSLFAPAQRPAPDLGSPWAIPATKEPCHGSIRSWLLVYNLGRLISREGRIALPGSQRCRGFRCVPRRVEAAPQPGGLDKRAEGCARTKSPGAGLRYRLPREWRRGCKSVLTIWLTM